MRTVRRLRLRYLLFRTICVLLPSLLAHHVETGRAQQNTLDLQYSPYPGVAQSNMLWWTRGESNSRPQRLQFEGITTIL